MPKSRKAGKKNSGNNGKRQTLDVSGFLQRVGVPVPRLPFLIGTQGNLAPKLAIYPSMIKLDIPITLQLITVALGATTSVTAVNLGVCTDFATKFANVFQEYAIVGAILEIRLGTVASPGGLVYCYLSETSSSAATLLEASELPHIDIDVATGTGNRNEVHLIKWKPTNLLDLDWSATSTTATPFWLKFFSSIAGTGTVSGTYQILVTGTLAFCFRGYAPA